MIVTASCLGPLWTASHRSFYPFFYAERTTPFRSHAINQFEGSSLLLPYPRATEDEGESITEPGCPTSRALVGRPGVRLGASSTADPGCLYDNDLSPHLFPVLFAVNVAVEDIIHAAVRGAVGIRRRHGGYKLERHILPRIKPNA